MANPLTYGEFHLLRARIAHVEFNRLIPGSSASYQEDADQAVAAADALLDALGLPEPPPTPAPKRDARGRFSRMFP